jgi:rhamnosyltransferase
MQSSKRKIIFAGIILYNPEPIRLKQNISAIIHQVDKILLIDNASSNINEIESMLSKFNIDIFIKNEINRGISVALNQLLSHGKDLNADWMLTLDQDSICPVNMISLYRHYLWENIGIVTCSIRDRNVGLDKICTKEWEYVSFCITSGSLTSVKAWERVGGFDESMFIDGVDTDFCCSLIENDLQILRVNTIELLHEVGRKSKKVTFCGKEKIIFNHPSFRCYYIARNLIYNGRKHKTLPNPFRRLLTVLFRILLIIIYEQDKYNKGVAIIRGCFSGFRSHIKL